MIIHNFDDLNALSKYVGIMDLHRTYPNIGPIAQAPKVSKKFDFFPPKFCYVIFVVQKFLFQKTKSSGKNVCTAWRKSWFPWQPITKFDN